MARENLACSCKIKITAGRSYYNVKDNLGFDRTCPSCFFFKIIDMHMILEQLSSIFSQPTK
jgi:hypothetical protein